MAGCKTDDDDDDDTPATVAVTGITLNKTTATITVGSTETLTATVAPDTATDKTVTWSSDNTDAATVDSAGVVTAVAEGSATITATAGGKSATCAVTVEQSAKPAATVTTAPTGAAIVGVGKTTALVSGGAADGGTLMYAVTTTNTKPTSTDGFSASVPTAQTITASGKVYVWYYVKADDTHSDSEIAATAIEVPVAIIWDATNISDLMRYGTDPYEKEGVTLRGNVDNVRAMWDGNGNPETDGIAFEAYQSGGFTFTAPDGKAFTKIEMKPKGPAGWDGGNLGDGWTLVEDFVGDDENEIYTHTVTWKGSAAASTVGLLTDANYFNTGNKISYIAFYLSE